MGRPAGKLHDRPFQMRASADFLKSVDSWRNAQPDKPSRAEAFRRLVALGLSHSKPIGRTSPKAAAKASEMAGQAVERLADQSVPLEERSKRKRRLLKGPGVPEPDIQVAYDRAREREREDGHHD